MYYLCIRTRAHEGEKDLWSMMSAEEVSSCYEADIAKVSCDGSQTVKIIFLKEDTESENIFTAIRPPLTCSAGRA